MIRRTARKRKVHPRMIPFPNCRILFKEAVKEPLRVIRRPTAVLIFEGLIYLEPDGFMMLERDDGERLLIQATGDDRFLLWRDRTGRFKYRHPRPMGGLQTEKLAIAFFKKK